MTRQTATLVLVALLLGASAALAADRNAPPPSPKAVAPPASGVPREPAAHRRGELDCTQCHLGKHQAVVRMYLGMGGRGTPMIPSHMMQVRVECAACHVAPKESEATASLVGQTFRPSEQACVTCHGEKYRGMLDRWSTTLATMRAIVGQKLQVARAALAGAPAKDKARARTRTLVSDAQSNLDFVALGRGVHNVFYAADLLKVANGWLDEAIRREGRSGPHADDTLVRGGYCAVLCHEQAGVRVPETVTFGPQKLPHGRHVFEFGAVCTACHSAEAHRKLTATRATCSGCHHAPQNDRCESCHKTQADFYRGETKTPHAAVAPNLMASSVTCTGCHDWSRKHSRPAVAQKCLDCHDAPYGVLATEWTKGFDADVKRTTDAVQAAERAVARARAGDARTAAQALVKQARDALGLVRTARPAHNPLAADALLASAREKAEAARAKLGGR